MSAPAHPHQTRLRAPRTAVGVVRVGTSLGVFTGAGLGLVTGLTLVVASVGSTDGVGQTTAALVVYGGLAAFGGAVVGGVDALLVSLVLALARSWIGDRVTRGRLLAGCVAGGLGTVAATAIPPLWAVGFGTVCAAVAAGWSRLVLELPR